MARKYRDAELERRVMQLEADAQVRALQEAYEAMRRPTP